MCPLVGAVQSRRNSVRLGGGKLSPSFLLLLPPSPPVLWLLARYCLLFLPHEHLLLSLDLLATVFDPVSGAGLEVPVAAPPRWSD